LAQLLDPIAAARAQLKLTTSGAYAAAPSTTAVLERIRNSLLPHQLDFCDDTSHRKLGLVCGFGAGKTHGLVSKAVTLAAMNIGYVSALFEPTAPMLRDILERTINDLLDEWQIPYTFRASPLPEYVLTFAEGEHTILLRTMETWGRLRGQNLCAIGFDEADTSSPRIAENATRMALARLRSGNIRQFFAATTPEGYGWAYHTFHRDAKEDTRLIQARTEDNPHLPDDFIPSLEANYPSNLIEAYLNGQFVNLTTGQVYDRFDRDKHVQPVTWDVDETILLGVDFNVGNMSGILAVRRGNTLHIFDEISGAHDTDSLAQEVRRRYGKARILGYPDASGAARSTNSSRSDVAILEAYDINNMAPKANPPVRDRIAAVQALLENGKGDVRLFVDPSCKRTIECLELQSYNDKGDPDKEAGFDHMNDALGYIVHRCFEVGRATSGKAVRGLRLY
jgi:hypothetical protein